MERHTISGFMVVKDVLSQGYPFVEAIASALPVCDEFLVSDGYSTDGTFEIIQKISKLNKKVKVFRQKWPVNKTMGVIGEVSNDLRQKCSSEYIFSVQANEVIHEESVEYLRGLPTIRPNVRAFSLPYLSLSWIYKTQEEFRLRLAKNLPSIVNVGDAWTLGLSKAFVRTEALKSLRNPRRLLRYVGRGIEWTYADPCRNSDSMAMYPPKPVFRYWSLFPKNYIEKCEKHKEMFNIIGFDKHIKILKDLVDGDQETFWKVAADIARKEQGFNYPEALGVVEKGFHPKLVQGLLLNKTKNYYVRDEVLESVAEL